MSKKSKNNEEKKPWLREYYQPPSGSRFMVLRSQFENTDNKTQNKQTS